MAVLLNIYKEAMIKKEDSAFKTENLCNRTGENAVVYLPAGRRGYLLHICEMTCILSVLGYYTECHGYASAAGRFPRFLLKQPDKGAYGKVHSFLRG
jgi:hypothetical protein